MIPRGAASGRTCVLRRRGLLAVFALLCAAAPARAQAPATISVDDVRVGPGGRERVVVSVLDVSGSPVPDLGRAFSVSLDGAAVEDLVARPRREVRPSARVTLLVDASLLRGSSLPDLQDAVRALGRVLEPGDRIRVVAVSGRTRQREASAGDAAGLASGLGALADDGTPLLYDALSAAARDAARLPGRRAGALLLVTRGADGGSRHGPLDVLAFAKQPGRLTPLVVVLLGDVGGAPESDRLQRLAAHTGGAVSVVTASPAIASNVPSLVERALGQWVLTFRTASHRLAGGSHRLEVVVESQGARRAASLEFDAREARVAPWWRTPLPWLMLLALLVLGALGLAFVRRPQRGLLVHDHDADDGVWYELFAYPVTLGAAAGNDIVFHDPQVSRNHAVLERRGRTVELADLNSENGTFVNGERVSRRALADGDRLSLGESVHLVYEARG